MEELNLEQVFGKYMAWKLDDKTWMISFMGGTQYLYLLEGEERALLIDTGWGAGNLRNYVEKLTAKDIIVANTHFHPDHSGSNGEFENVYVSEDWEVDAKTLSPGMGPFDLTKLPNPDYKKVLLKDGDIIDLGNRKIEVIKAKPAHCNSSLFFYDRENGLLFTGDEFESAQTLMYDNSHNPDAPYHVEQRICNMKENALRLKKLENQYTYLLPNHNGAPIAKSYLEDYIGLADAIFAGTAIIEDKLNHEFIERDPIASQLCRVRYKNVSIIIKKADLLTIYGNK